MHQPWGYNRPGDSRSGVYKEQNNRGRAPKPGNRHAVYIKDTVTGEVTFYDSHTAAQEYMQITGVYHSLKYGHYMCNRFRAFLTKEEADSFTGKKEIKTKKKRILHLTDLQSGAILRPMMIHEAAELLGVTYNRLSVVISKKSSLEYRGYLIKVEVEK